MSQEAKEFELAHKLESDGSYSIRVKFPRTPKQEEFIEHTKYSGSAVIWHIKDMPHFKDGPAVLYTNLLMANGLPSEDWIYEGKYHRVNGAAIIRPHGSSWWKMGRRHRYNGPARIETKNGAIDQQWWINGTQIENVRALLEKHELSPDDYEQWTEAEQTLALFALTP
jgi:hypothetical protein